MLYAAIDIHKSVFQTALLDPASGELTDARWLVLLLAKELLPEAWLPPAGIQ